MAVPVVKNPNTDIGRSDDWNNSIKTSGAANCRNAMNFSPGSPMAFYDGTPQNTYLPKYCKHFKQANPLNGRDEKPTLRNEEN